MKLLTFNNEEYYIIDETIIHYICEPANRYEGYQYYSKTNKHIKIKEV